MLGASSAQLNLRRRAGGDIRIFWFLHGVREGRLRREYKKCQRKTMCRQEDEEEVDDTRSKCLQTKRGVRLGWL